MMPQQWVFGGICRETKEAFVVAVEDRSCLTLMNAIWDNIKEGTTIYSARERCYSHSIAPADDCWKGYPTKELLASGYEHFKVNHTYNFVDPSSGAHTQNIQRVWGSGK